MKNTIYLIKETTINEGVFNSIEVKAFLNYENALKYVEKELENYSEFIEEDDDVEIIEDGLESVIFDDDNFSKILYSVDLMELKEDTNPKTIHLYTEVNAYDSGEVISHALGFLTQQEAKNEMMSEICNRSKKDSENYYWISDGDIDDGYIELNNEYGDISYLECSSITLNLDK